MSIELNTAFRRDPIGTASRTPIVSFDRENSGVLKDKGVAAERLRSVRGSHRIVAMDLKQAANAFTIGVDEDNVDARLLAGWLPCYYLPWIANGVARTTLRPRSATTRAGIAKNLVPLNANPAYRVDQNDPHSAVLDPNDPDMFFTSAVNGCSVTVRGTREEPIVYHANARNLEVEGENSPLRAALQGRGDAFAGEIMGAKRDWMLAKVDRLEQVDPKQRRGAAPHTAAAPRMLGQQQYQMLVSGGSVARSEKTAAKAIMGDIAREEDGRTKELRLASSQGTVFGLRSNGLWTFYYQKLVKYDWWRDTSPFFKKANWVKDATRAAGYRVVEFGEFWPNGVGILIP